MLMERLERGDDDSLVNLWLYGASFTRLAPVRSREGRDDPGLEPDGRIRTTTLTGERLDDFLDALAKPRENERLMVARDIFARKGIDVSTKAGRAAARQHLTRARARAIQEFGRTDERLNRSRSLAPAVQLETHSTIFQDRGLSADTSLLVDFALERALVTLGAGGVLAPGSVRRVAIVGPGLDVINKADGHDFYPLQSIQPFAVLDTLLRIGLADGEALAVTTLDVSEQVNRHLLGARARASLGQDYQITLPLPRAERWVGDLRTYWQTLGAHVGTSVRAPDGPGAEDVDTRAVLVRPEAVLRVTPLPFDIVTHRLEALTEAEQFDLVIATNVFVYYDPFEQALAGANIAAMLRPGGILLSNNDLFVMAPISTSVGHLAVTYSDRQNDNVFVYQRQPRAVR